MPLESVDLGRTLDAHTRRGTRRQTDVRRRIAYDHLIQQRTRHGLRQVSHGTCARSEQTALHRRKTVSHITPDRSRLGRIPRVMDVAERGSKFSRLDIAVKAQLLL